MFAARKWLAHILLTLLPDTLDSIRLEHFDLASCLETAHSAFVLLASWWKPDQSWEALDTIFCAERLAFGRRAINFADIDLTLCRVSQLGPDRSELLTMTTPWGVELNKPSFL